jgi:hypothetical protein
MDGGGEDLTLIPRSVRDKLDRVGIKLHLREWEDLDLAVRRRLFEQPCDGPDEIGEYRSFLVRAVVERTGREPEKLSR